MAATAPLGPAASLSHTRTCTCAVCLQVSPEIQSHLLFLQVTAGARGENLVPRGWQGSSPTRALRTDLPVGAAQGGEPASSRSTVGPRGRQAGRALPGEWGSDDWGPRRGGGGDTQPGSTLAPIYALASTSAFRAVTPPSRQTMLSASHHVHSMGGVPCEGPSQSQLVLG